MNKRRLGRDPTKYQGRLKSIFRRPLLYQFNCRFAFEPAHNILSSKAAEGKGSNISSGNRFKEYNGIEYTYDIY